MVDSCLFNTSFFNPALIKTDSYKYWNEEVHKAPRSKKVLIGNGVRNIKQINPYMWHEFGLILSPEDEELLRSTKSAQKVTFYAGTTISYVKNTNGYKIPFSASFKGRTCLFSGAMVPENCVILYQDPEMLVSDSKETFDQSIGLSATYNSIYKVKAIIRKGDFFNPSVGIYAVQYARDIVIESLLIRNKHGKLINE